MDQFSENANTDGTSSESQFSVLAVGALYRDVIIKVPTFPAEDEKQSAVSEHTRVGGNISNTLSVLSQVIPKTSPLIYATVVGGSEAIWRYAYSAGLKCHTPNTKLWLLWLMELIITAH